LQGRISYSTRRTIESFGDPGIAAAISFTINSQFPIFRGDPMLPSRLIISVSDLLLEGYRPVLFQHGAQDLSTTNPCPDHPRQGEPAAAGTGAISFMPLGDARHAPRGWVRPLGRDARRGRFHANLRGGRKKGIGIAPGTLFSTAGRYGNCIRLNAAFWSERVEQALETVGGIILS